MRQISLVAFLFALSLGLHGAEKAEDDDVFRSITQQTAADPSFRMAIDDVDDVFDTRGLAVRLAAMKRVRLFRETHPENPGLPYWDFEEKQPLRDKLSKGAGVVEVAKADFRPVLKLAADFDQYGVGSMCTFSPGVAVLLGDEEPSFVLVCCFSCNDIHIVRRPTAEHPRPQIAGLEMSPELERALFELTQKAFPADAGLQGFKLKARKRATSPTKPRSPETKDASAPDKSKKR